MEILRISLLLSLVLLACGTESSGLREGEVTTCEETVSKRGFIGVSAWGGTHPDFPVPGFMRQYPHDIWKPAIALMPGSFGWDRRLLSAFRYKYRDRQYLIEIAVSNGPGRRRGSWASDFLPRYSIDELNRALEMKDPFVLDAIKRRAQRLEAWLYPGHDRPSCEVLAILYELEDNLTDAAWKVFRDTFKENFNSPYVEVRNPCKGGEKLFTAMKEGHGVNVPRNGIWNMDGVSVDLKDDSDYDKTITPTQATQLLKRARKGSFAGFLWLHDEQGWHDVEDYNMRTPPKDRSYIIPPSSAIVIRKVLRAAGR